MEKDEYDVRLISEVSVAELAGIAVQKITSAAYIFGREIKPADLAGWAKIIAEYVKENIPSNQYLFLRVQDLIFAFKSGMEGQIDNGGSDWLSLRLLYVWLRNYRTSDIFVKNRQMMETVIKKYEISRALNGPCDFELEEQRNAEMKDAILQSYREYLNGKSWAYIFPAALSPNISRALTSDTRDRVLNVYMKKCKDFNCIDAKEYNNIIKYYQHCKSAGYATLWK